jgi:hypothetical protein
MAAGVSDFNFYCLVYNHEQDSYNFPSPPSAGRGIDLAGAFGTRAFSDQVDAAAFYLSPKGVAQLAAGRTRETAHEPSGQAGFPRRHPGAARPRGGIEAVTEVLPLVPVTAAMTAGWRGWNLAAASASDRHVLHLDERDMAQQRPVRFHR